MSNEKKPDLSIHPRVVKTGNAIGHTVHPKVNTSKKPQRATLERKIAHMETHMEVHTRDGSTSKHIGLLKKRLETV